MTTIHVGFVGMKLQFDGVFFRASVLVSNLSFLPFTTAYSSITASEACDRLDQLAWSQFHIGAGDWMVLE
jgi:hypothetical protein